MSITVSVEVQLRDERERLRRMFADPVEAAERLREALDPEVFEALRRALTDSKA